MLSQLCALRLQIDLSSNSIGGHEEDDGYDSDGDEKTKFVYDPAGVQAIADALGVNTSLTSVTLLANSFDDATVILRFRSNSGEVPEFRYQPHRGFCVSFFCALRYGRSMDGTLINLVRLFINDCSLRFRGASHQPRARVPAVLLALFVSLHGDYTGPCEKYTLFHRSENTP